MEMTKKQISRIKLATFNAIKGEMGEEFDCQPIIFYVVEIEAINQTKRYIIQYKTQINPNFLEREGFKINQCRITCLYEVNKQVKQAYSGSEWIVEPV